MSVVARILDGPISRELEASARPAGGGPVPVVVDGARLRFEGVVRTLEDGRPLLALEYETYDPMAERELASLGRDVVDRHRLSGLTVLHSRGRVAVGEVSFVLEVWAPHRAATLAATAEFIDRLKQDVPIWKRPVWAT